MSKSHLFDVQRTRTKKHVVKPTIFGYLLMCCCWYNIMFFSGVKLQLFHVFALDTQNLCRRFPQDGPPNCNKLIDDIVNCTLC